MNVKSQFFSDSIFVDRLLRFSSFSTRPGLSCSTYISGILLWWSFLYSIITIMLRVWLRWANTPTCLSSLCHWLALELCDHRLQQTSMQWSSISWRKSHDHCHFFYFDYYCHNRHKITYTVPFLEACLFLISPVKSWEMNKNERDIIKFVPPALLSR